MADLRLDAAIADSVAYLESAEARASLERDPYWPKWHSPWWHVLALEEARRVDAVPLPTLLALAEVAARHYVPFFPRAEAELPAGMDWFRQVMCHCQLGSLLRVLHASGIDGEAAIPWTRGWLARYQLPDGGWNCDEKAYTRAQPKSSFVSTLPALEYLLARGRHGGLPDAGAELLDGGAAYLLRHRLVCSVRTGVVVHAGWLDPTLPRFYEYDALRGLSFVVGWAELRRRPLALRDLSVGLDALRARFDGGAPAEPRRWHEEHQTRLSASPAPSGWGPGETFPLLHALREGAAGPALLEDEWRRAQAALERLTADGLIS